MPFDIAEANEQLDDILDAIDDGDLEPSNWEEEFIESVESRLNNGQELMGSQSDKLEELWKKVAQQNDDD